METNDLSKIYYRQRDGSYYTKMTKDEIAQKIDPTKLSTFVPILKDMNYVIMLDQWFNYYSKHPTSKGVIGRYISFMHLSANRQLDYNFTEFYFDWVKKRKNYPYVIELQDEDSMHHQHFCPKCHYWLFGENIGINYCPHCGTELVWDWDVEKIERLYRQRYEMSIKRYEELMEYAKQRYL